MVCKNCKRLLPQQINFCNGCGAKVIKNRLTMRNLFEDFAYRYLNYDNQFLRTFLHLFTKPEEVIGSYINGTRKKYVNVISYFAIAITLSGFQIYFQNKFYPELVDMSSFARSGDEKAMEGYMNFMQEFQSIVFMLIVPFYALLSKLTFYNIKKYNFTEHLVLNMYTAAHFSILSSIIIVSCLAIGVQFSTASVVMLVLQVFYTAYVFKRILSLSLKRILWKTVLFILLLSCVFFAIIIMGFLSVLLVKGLT